MNPAWFLLQLNSVVLRGRRVSIRNLETIDELPQHSCHPWRQCCASNGLGGAHQQSRRLNKRRRFCVTQHEQMFTNRVRDPHTVAIALKSKVYAGQGEVIQSPYGDIN
jgi:hypothetical protein